MAIRFMAKLLGQWTFISFSSPSFGNPDIMIDMNSLLTADDIPFDKICDSSTSWCAFQSCILQHNSNSTTIWLLSWWHCQWTADLWHWHCYHLRYALTNHNFFASTFQTHSMYQTYLATYCHHNGWYRPYAIKTKTPLSMSSPTDASSILMATLYLYLITHHPIFPFFNWSFILKHIHLCPLMPTSP